MVAPFMSLVCGDWGVAHGWIIDYLASAGSHVYEYGWLHLLGVVGVESVCGLVGVWHVVGS